MSYGNKEDRCYRYNRCPGESVFATNFGEILMMVMTIHSAMWSLLSLAVLIVLTPEEGHSTNAWHRTAEFFLGGGSGW